MTRKLTLTVNDADLSLDYFVENFIDHTTGGMVESLEETGPVKTLDILIDGERLSVTLNGSSVRANPFVTRMLRNTLTGMVSSLKGVGEVHRLHLTIKR